MKHEERDLERQCVQLARRHGWDAWKNENIRRCAFIDDIEGGIEDAIPNYIDWLNAHHFDIRGLIEKGIALEAPEGMYEN